MSLEDTHIAVLCLFEAGQMHQLCFMGLLQPGIHQEHPTVSQASWSHRRAVSPAVCEVLHDCEGNVLGQQLLHCNLQPPLQESAATNGWRKTLVCRTSGLLGLLAVWPAAVAAQATWRRAADRVRDGAAPMHTHVRVPRTSRGSVLPPAPQGLGHSCCTHAMCRAFKLYQRSFQGDAAVYEALQAQVQPAQQGR